MELKQGYKKTEVGVLPEDWAVSVWGNVLEGFSSGATPYRENYSFYKGNIKWVTSGELNYNVIYETLEHISEEAKEKTNLKVHPSNTFLMAITGLEAAGTRGSCAILGTPATTNQSCMAIYGTDALDIKYLYYYYLKYGKELAIRYCQGTKQQSYTAKIVKQLTVFYPMSDDEQKTIVSALSDIDELLLSLEKLIAKKKNIKLGAMQELLTGKKRLPQFSGKWKSCSLDELLLMKKTKLDPQSANVIYRCIELEHIESQTGRILGWVEAYQQLSLKTKFSKGNILFGKLRPYLRKFALAPFDGVCSSEIWVFNTRDEKIDIRFMYYVLQRDCFIDAANTTTGTKMPRAEWSLLKNFNVILPDELAEQTAIATVLSDMDSEIEALEKKLFKYRNIKQGMMQELLTGRIRLIEKAVAATGNIRAVSAKNYKSSSHNKEFDEAVVISVLSAIFGNEQFPMPAFRRQKFAYLLHRYCSGQAKGYEKFAAGPYNPHTKYGGPEKIAQSKGYVKRHKTQKYAGFIAGEKLEEAMAYFEKWYGKVALNWLEQFRKVKNEELELLTTVDMAITDLYKKNREITPLAVKAIIQNSVAWKAKLNRAIFSDTNITKAIEWSNSLFGS